LTGYLKEVARIREKITLKEIQDQQLLKDWKEYCENIGKKYFRKQWYYSQNYQRAKYDLEEYQSQAWLEVLELINKGIEDKELIKKKASNKVRTKWRKDNKARNVFSLNKIKDDLGLDDYETWFTKKFQGPQENEYIETDYQDALNKLTEKQRKVKKLREEDYTYEQIGKMLKVSKQAVQKIDMKATKKIAEYMTK
jgi:RNA polymerase sigma factor (sigma-70 family)